MLAAKRVCRLVQRLPVEIGKSVFVLREMSGYPVYDYSYIILMQFLYEIGKVRGRAVARSGREVPRDLIPPRAVVRIFRRADKFEVSVAHLF